MKRLATVPCFLALAIVIAGCAASIDPRLPPRDERTTAIDKLPLTVGAFYGEDFRAYAFTTCVVEFNPPPCAYYDHSLTVNLGKTSVALLDRTMRSLFAHIERLDRRHPPPKKLRSLAAVFTPKIIGYGYSYGGPSSGWHAWVAYQLTLYTTNGKELAQWTAYGAGKSEGGPGLHLNKIEDATLVALRAAEAHALAQFHERKEIKSWLAALCIPETGTGRNRK